MSRLDGYRTLLLSSSFEPIRTVDWRRAFVLDLQDRVDVIEYYDVSIRGVSARFLLPAVVRIRQYLRYIHRGVPLNRRNVFLRDRGQCQYCARSPSPEKLTLDHVFPKSRGGPASWENLVAACERCNRKKGANTPKEARMPLLSVPQRPRGFRSFAPAGAVPPEWSEYII